MEEGWSLPTRFCNSPDLIVTCQWVFSAKWYKMMHHNDPIHLSLLEHIKLFFVMFLALVNIIFLSYTSNVMDHRYIKNITHVSLAGGRELTRTWTRWARYLFSHQILFASTQSLRFACSVWPPSSLDVQQTMLLSSRTFKLVHFPVVEWWGAKVIKQ